MHFNKLLNIINAFLLFFKEIQNKSFLSAFLGDLHPTLMKVKANSKEPKASGQKDNLLSSPAGRMPLPTSSPERQGQFSLDRVRVEISQFSKDYL